MAKFTPPPGYNPSTDSSYHYIPNEGAALFFVLFFGLSALIHLYQAIRYRMWWLFATALLALSGETLGWSARLWSSFDDGVSDTPFTIQIVALIVSPTPLIAVYFLLFGRIVLFLGPQYSRMKGQKYTRLFTIVDIVSLLVQIFGGIQATGNNDNSVRIGGYVSLGGIAFQLTSLIFYSFLVIEFMFRFHRNRPIRSRLHDDDVGLKYSEAAATAGESRLSFEDLHHDETLGSANVTGKFYLLSRPTRHFLIGMAISLSFLFIRGIYRTIELTEGWTGKLIRNQATFSIFDGLMVLFAVWTLNIFHPGRLLPRRYTRWRVDWNMRKTTV